MFKYVAQEFKKRRLKEAIIKSDRLLSCHNLETAKKCTLFWVADDLPLSSVEKLREALAEHVEVDLLAFVKRSKLVTERDERVVYVDESSISYRGKLNDERLRKVLEQETDFFIDLSVKTNLLSDYLVKCSRACCIIGMERKGIEHDVELAGVKDMDVFGRRLFELLTKINTY